MANTTFGALFAKAKEEGAFASLVPDGDYVIEIVRCNAGESKNGDPKLGLQIKPVSYGSEDNFDEIPSSDAAKASSAWVNLNFTEKSSAISFRQLKSFGLSDDFLEQSESVEQIGEALVGTRLDVTIGHRNWGANGENTDNTIKVHSVVTPPSVGSDVSEAEVVEDGEAY